MKKNRSKRGASSSAYASGSDVMRGDTAVASGGASSRSGKCSVTLPAPSTDAITP